MSDSQTSLKETVNDLKASHNRLQRRLGVDDLIDNHVKRKYNSESPQTYAGNLLEMVKDRYEANVAVWHQVILDLGSAYAKAHATFNDIQTIHTQEIRARQQMKANILSIIGAAGMGWVLNAVVSTQIFNLAFRSQGAKSFFSAGLQEMADQGNSGFAEWIAQRKITVAPNSDTNLTNGEVIDPLPFQNSLEKAFTTCRGKVTGQLTDMIEAVRARGGGPIKNILNRYNGTDVDYALSDREITQKVDAPYLEIKAFVKDVCEQYKKEAFYFRVKPSWVSLNETQTNHGTTNEFTRMMALHFERALWAGWIPHNLRWIEKTQVPKSRTLVVLKPWRTAYNSPAVLQTLEPGLYALHADMAMNIREVFVKPGKTLKGRLEELHIIKLRKTINLSPEGIKPLDFGLWTSTSDIKSLVDWARNQGQSRYGLHQFRLEERPDDQLTIKPLA